MNKETVNHWLCKNSPISSTGLRRELQITVKGTPIATRLSDLVATGFATVKKGRCKQTDKLVNIYSSTAAGKKWDITNRKSKVKIIDTVQEINLRDYTVNPAGSPKTNITRALMSSRGKDAMGAIAELLGADGEARKLLKGTAIRLRSQAMVIDEFLNHSEQEQGEDENA